MVARARASLRAMSTAGSAETDDASLVGPEGVAAGVGGPVVAGGGWRSPQPFPLRTAAAVFLLLLVVAGLFNFVVIQKLPGISPVDGPVYADALDRAFDFRVTVKGDRLGEATVEYIGCRGIQGVGSLDAACDEPRLNRLESSSEASSMTGAQAWARELFKSSLSGYTTAYVHPPTYFFLTAGVVKAVQVVAPGVYAFDIARMVGALWFAVGALLMVWLATLWGARPWPAALVMVALLPTPTGATTFSFITPDSMSLMVCGGVALGVTLWWRDRLPAWSLIFFGLLTAAVKQTYFLAAVAGVLLIAMLWWRQHTRPTRACVSAAVFVGAGAVIGLVGWDLIKRFIEVVPGDISTGPDPFAVSLDFNGVAQLIFTAAADFPNEAAGPLLAVPPAALAMSMGFGLALAAATGGALLYRSTRSDEFILAASGGLTVVFGGLLVSLMYLLSSGIFLPPIVRYIFGGIPLVLLPLMLATSSRAVRVLLVVLAAVSYIGWMLYP